MSTEGLEPPVAVAGDRSVPVGRDVIHSILVTGNDNTVFVGPYQPLADAYKRPTRMDDEHGDYREFVGRAWIEAEIDAFIATKDSGYIILEAPAGVGKTAFLYNLVKRRSYIHVFVGELFSGEASRQENAEVCRKSLAAQLILACQHEAGVPEVLDAGAGRPEFLHEILAKVAAQRDQKQKGHPIVIVVDAVDDAWSSPGVASRSSDKGNPLGLPRKLPKDVFFIVSQRPVRIDWLLDDESLPIKLEPDDERNIDDMRQYLRAVAREDGIQQALAAANPGSDGRAASGNEFAELLQRKSEGLWIYLHYVVQEIRNGTRALLDLEALPDGLWAYYRDHWRHWQNQDQEAWDHTYWPLLSTLAAAQERLPLSLWLRLAGLSEETTSTRRREKIIRLLGEHWAPFLTWTEKADETIYGFYHETLRSFFRGDTPERSRPRLRAEGIFADELRRGTRDAHERIARQYLDDAWGGLEAGLPRLPGLSTADDEQGYGIRRVIAHLAAAGLRNELSGLLQLERTRTETALEAAPASSSSPENFWYSGHEQAGRVREYITQIDLAHRLAAATARASATKGEPSPAVGDQVLYALISASINSLAENLPPPVLLRLTDRVWSLEQAWAFAENVPDPRRRAEGLLALEPKVTGPLRVQFMEKTLASARAIADPALRAAELCRLVSFLPDRLVAPAIESATSAVREVGIPDVRAGCIAGLAQVMPDPGADTLTHLVDDLRSEALRGQALVGVVAQLRNLDRVEEALALARSISHPGARADALVTLAACVPLALLDEAEQRARAIPGQGHQARVLAQLAARRASLGQSELALDIARELTIEHARADVLATIAPSLNGALPAAIDLARMLEEPVARARALSALGAHLAGSDQAALAVDAYRAITGIADVQSRADAMIQLLDLAPEPLVGKLETAARGLRLAGARSRVLVELALRKARHGDAAPALTLVPRLPNQPLSEELDAQGGLDFRPHLAVQPADHAASPGLLRIMWMYVQQHWFGYSGGFASDNSDSDFIDRRHELQPDDPLPDRVEVLVRLEPWLTPRQAFEETRLLVSRAGQALVLQKLAPRFDDELVRHALGSMREIRDTAAQIYALARLSAYLPEAEQTRVVSLVLDIRDVETRGRMLGSVAQHLADELVRRALLAAQVMPHGRGQQWAFAGIAPRLAAIGQWPEAWKTLGAIDALDAWTACAVSMAPIVNAAGNTEAAFEMMARIGDPAVTGPAIAKLAPKMANEHVKSLLRMARLIGDRPSRAHALAAVAPHLPASECAEVFEEIKQVASDAARDARPPTHFGETLARCVATMAPFLPRPDRERFVTEAWTAARGVIEEEARARGLTLLAPHLPESLLSQTLDEVLYIKSHAARARTLSAMALRGDGAKSIAAMLDLGLAAANRIEHDGTRAQVLAEITISLVDLPLDLLHQAWSETLRALATRSRQDMLTGLGVLAPAIDRLGGQPAILQVNQAIYATARWWP